jgi:zinc/manganese transport system permease protein
VLSVVFALTSALGGIVLALGGGLPVSPYITTVSFLIYLGARAFEVIKKSRAKASVQLENHA